jgi:hypothetical protein
MLKHFLTKNALSTKYKLFGDLYVLSIEPFKDDAIKYAVYNKLKATYPDAYSLEITADDTQLAPQQKPVVKEVIKEEVISKEVVEKVKKEQMATETDPLLAKEPSLDEIKVQAAPEVKPQPVAQPVQEVKPTPVVEETQSSGGISDYIFEIFIFIILLITAIIFIISKRKKEDEDIDGYTFAPTQEEPHEIDEDEYEELDEYEEVDEYEDIEEDEKEEPIIKVPNNEQIDLSNIKLNEAEEAAAKK